MSGTPFAELYHDVEVQVAGQIVRVEATVAGPATLLDAFKQREVPGVRFPA